MADDIRKGWWIEGWSACDPSAQAPAKQVEQFTYPIVSTPAKTIWAQSTTLASPPTRHLLARPMQRRANAIPYSLNVRPEADGALFPVWGQPTLSGPGHP